MGTINSGLSGLPKEDFFYERSGITLRDYFAAAVASDVSHLIYIRGDVNADSKIWPPVKVAMHAYAVADAMLAEREKK